MSSPRPRRAALLLAGALLLSSAVLRADDGIVRPTRGEVRAQLRRTPRFAGPRASLPDSFRVQYTLARDADVSVTLLDLNRMPLRTFQVARGQSGAAAGENALTVWDGKDSKGGEMPSGEYWAAVSVRYADGTVENKRFRLVKP